MPYFDYTGKNIVTIETYEKHVKEEMKRVRELTGRKQSVWVVDHRPEGQLWEEDAITMLPGVGGKKVSC